MHQIWMQWWEDLCARTAVYQKHDRNTYMWRSLLYPGDLKMNENAADGCVMQRHLHM